MLRNQDGQIEFFDLLWYNFPKGGCFEMNEKKPVSNVCYQIAAKNGRVLEVADFNTASGAAVQLWDNVKEDSQIWLLVEVAEGLYKLENKLTGKVLDVINAGSQNGAWLHQWDYIGKDNQLWTLEPAADGRWKVRSKLSGRVLDIVGMSQENGARLQIWDDVDGENQAWKFTEVKAAKKTGLPRRKRRLQNAAVSPL